MNASQLRAISTGQTFALSPVVICDEHGNRFEYVTHTVICNKAPDKNGVEKPTAIPILTLVIRSAGTFNPNPSPNGEHE